MPDTVTTIGTTTGTDAGAVTLEDGRFRRAWRLRFVHALREHHGELTFPMRVAIARRLEEYSHEVGAETEVEPLLGDIDELVTALQTLVGIGPLAAAEKTMSMPHRVDVKLDGKHIVDLELALDVTLSLANIVLDIEKAVLSIEHVAFEAALSTNRVTYCTWHGKLGKLERDLTEHHADRAEARAAEDAQPAT